MAGVLESFIIPRSPAFPSAALTPTTTSVSANIKLAKLPEFRGLKVKSRFSTSFVRSTNLKSRIVRGAGRIVCESPDTAVEIEFWAPWCGPCRMIHPIIDELAKEYAGRLKCCKVNTDDSPSIATRYGIRSIPTVIIFRNGEKKDAVIGAVPKSTLAASIEKFL